MARASVLHPDFDSADDLPGFAGRWARVARQAGAERLGASLYELPAGQAICPYHFELTNEEMLVVLEGRPSVRTPEGWRDLARGDVVAFPRGEAGAHQVANRSEGPARVLMVSEMADVDVTIYPDSEKVGVFDSSGRRQLFREPDAVDYWEGESPPAAKGEAPPAAP